MRVGPGAASLDPPLLTSNEIACVRRHGKLPRDDCRFGGCGSQFGEDWALLPTLLQATQGRARRARFVEIGAYRGASLSNTLMYERCFNWTGVLIEASPPNFQALRASGRKARLVHSAVCNGDGKTNATVPIAVEGYAVSGQLELMSPSFIRTHRKEGPGLLRNSNISHVPCRSLQSILRLPSPLPSTRPSFDLLSLDVEGAEERVISTVDPAAFAVIVVEADGTDRAKEQRVEKIILEAGLRRQARGGGIGHIRLSRVYLRPEVAELPPWRP